MEIIAAKKTGSRNVNSYSPKTLIDALDSMEKRVCWLEPEYVNIILDRLEETCSK